MSNAALPYHFLKPSRKSFIWKKSDAERRGEDVESGAWHQGTGSRLRGSWGGKGANLVGGDSAFICITRMHCTQYVQCIIWIYRRFPLNILFRRMSLRPLMWRDLLTTSSRGLTLFLPLILSVLGVSFFSSVRAQARSDILSLNSSIAVQTKSSRTKKERKKKNFTLASGFWRSYELK